MSKTLNAWAIDIETCASDGPPGPGRAPSGATKRRRDEAFDPWRGRIRLITAKRGREIHQIDLFKERPGTLFRKIRGCAILAHNSMFELLWLLHKYPRGFKPCAVWDTMIASRLLTNGDDAARNDLGSCASRYLDKPMEKELGASDWSVPVLSPAQMAYNRADVIILPKLHAVLVDELEARDLYEMYRFELGLLLPIAYSVVRGVGWDKDAAAKLLETKSRESTGHAERVRELLSLPDLNVNSPAQLAHALQVKSTDQSAMARLRTNKTKGPAVQEILAYRSANKMADFYAKWSEKTDVLGCVHPRLNSTGAATGRFTCKEPNLQQAPNGPFRECVTAVGDDMGLVIADYSQIELRAAAAITADPAMLESFRAGKDLHCTTARKIKGIPEDEDVPAEIRKTAKGVNFGMLYGQSAKGLKSYLFVNYGIEMSLEDAMEWRDGWFEAYPGIYVWHWKAWRAARTPSKMGNCVVETVMGRQRVLPRDGDKEWHRFSRRVNTEVQGTCADAMKAAILLFQTRKRAGWRFFLTVHDELAVEAPVRQLWQAGRVMGLSMVDAFVEHPKMREVFSAIPIRAEVYAGKTWGAKGDPGRKVGEAILSNGTAREFVPCLANERELANLGYRRERDGVSTDAGRGYEGTNAAGV